MINAFAASVMVSFHSLNLNLREGSKEQKTLYIRNLYGMYFLIFARKVWRALSEIGSKKELISREKPAVCPHSTTV